MLNTERLDPIIYTLIVNKYATLKEIRDDYTIEEVLDLYESCLIFNYNRNEICDKIRNK